MGYIDEEIAGVIARDRAKAQENARATIDLRAAVAEANAQALSRPKGRRMPRSDIGKFHRSLYSDLYSEVEAMEVHDCLRWTFPRGIKAARVVNAVAKNPKLRADGLRRFKFVRWFRTVYVIRVR